MEPLPSTEGSITDGYDYEEYVDEAIDFTTIIGRRWHIEFIKIPKLTKNIIIEAEVENNPNARIGIWAPNSDTTHYKLSAGEAFEYDKFNETANIHTMTKNWTFGKKSRIELFTEPVNDEREIQLLILARPVYANLGNELKIKFKVTINGDEPVMHTRLYQQRNKIDDEQKNILMKKEYDLFEQLHANLLDGFGNIVHPKQYFTIRGFNYLNDEVEDISENGMLKLGYIGTDTTENLRSLIRWMNANKILTRVNELVLYYTTEWDKVFFRTIRLKEELNEQYPSLKITPRELSEGVIAAEKSRKDCDIVIATYVAPWISGEDSKRDYVNLLNNIIGRNSYLISVDPKNAHNSVRSILRNRSYNNDELYKSSENEDGLGLICFKGPVTSESESVEWSIWWRGN